MTTHSVPPPAPPTPPVNRRRRWLHAGVAGWAVVLLVATAVSVHRDEPTVREQRSVGQATPVVERAVGDLVVAAGPEVVVELAEPRRRTGCRLTPLREGATLEAGVTLRAPAADADAALDRIADRLPPHYHAGVGREPDGAARSLWADAGEFVLVEGEVSEPGLVTLTVSTGCRPTSDGSDGPAVPPLPPADPDPARVLTALGATDVAPAGPTAAACPGQGRVWTVRATGRGVPAAPPGTLLPAPAGTVVVADTPELYAYRAGPLSVVVEALDGRIRAATTTGCPG
ncbi:hypothetical protein [Plantactinospora sp. CA-290183]|uniref:hypothetical protein n=1 Tax=Plantactinospora sp. CA-290183 TaxID=3240006 RepID=UPI003D90A1CE